MRFRRSAMIGLLALAVLAVGLLVEPRWAETYKKRMQADFSGHPFIACALLMK